MSQRERDRLYFVKALCRGELRQVDAARLLDLSVRQIRRLQRRFEAEGDIGVIHRLRGHPSNIKISTDVKEKALSLIRSQYSDFGPTLASEKLFERDGIEVSRETVRKWMIEAGIWKKRKRKTRHHLWRPRRSCFGELVQIDTSLHDWFEGRGGKAVLINAIDDATSRVWMFFYSTDDTRNNMALLWSYLRRFGRPLAIYVDKASHFKTTRQASLEEDLVGLPAQTQIQRALSELDIEHITAHSAQAKGRVERSFETAQDRLIKELRLEGISNIAEANKFLRTTFIPMWNKRFAHPPANPANAHRPRKGFDLAAIFSIQNTRTVQNDYTIQLNGQKYQIQQQSIGPGLRGAKVQIEQRLDETTRIRWRGKYLKKHKIEPKNSNIRTKAGNAETSVGLRPPSVSALHNKQLNQYPSQGA